MVKFLLDIRQLSLKFLQISFLQSSNLPKMQSSRMVNELRLIKCWEVRIRLLSLTEKNLPSKIRSDSGPLPIISSRYSLIKKNLSLNAPTASGDSQKVGASQLLTFLSECRTKRANEFYMRRTWASITHMFLQDISWARKVSIEVIMSDVDEGLSEVEINDEESDERNANFSELSGFFSSFFRLIISTIWTIFKHSFCAKSLASGVWKTMRGTAGFYWLLGSLNGWQFIIWSGDQSGIMEMSRSDMEE